jgi:hypothetical protein
MPRFGLVYVLGLFDVIGLGEAVAVDAVLSIFTTRPDMPDTFVFSGVSEKNELDVMTFRFKKNLFAEILEGTFSGICSPCTHFCRTLYRHQE